MQKAVNQNKTVYIDLQDVIDNLNRKTLAQLQRALKECRKQMNYFSANDPRMGELI